MPGGPSPAIGRASLAAASRISSSSSMSCAARALAARSAAPSTLSRSSCCCRLSCRPSSGTGKPASARLRRAPSASPLTMWPAKYCSTRRRSAFSFARNDLTLATPVASSSSSLATASSSLQCSGWRAKALPRCWYCSGTFSATSKFRNGARRASHWPKWRSLKTETESTAISFSPSISQLFAKSSRVSLLPWRFRLFQTHCAISPFLFVLRANSRRLMSSRRQALSW